MRALKKLKKIPPTPTTPPILPTPSKKRPANEICEKGILGTPSNKTIEIIYSKDRSMRYVISENTDGYFYYTLEKNIQKYIFESDVDTFDIQPDLQKGNCRIKFDDLSELKKAIENESYFKKHFVADI